MKPRGIKTLDYSLAEAARRLKTKPHRLIKWVKARRLNAVKHGRRWIVSRRAVELIVERWRSQDRIRTISRTEADKASRRDLNKPTEFVTAPDCMSRPQGYPGPKTVEIYKGKESVEWIWDTDENGLNWVCSYRITEINQKRS